MSILVGICLVFSAGASIVLVAALKATPRSSRTRALEDIEQMEAVKRG